MIAARPAATILVPPQAGNMSMAAERLRRLMLWLTGASGAIAFVEPSPYEVVSFLAFAIFTVGGLALSPTLLPLALLLVLINIGYSFSASAVIGETGVAMWIMTSWYLAATALFFAAMLGSHTEARLNALLRGCVAGGAIAALAAIVGYFRLFPSASDMLLLYDRARGTFKDPNVLGAFLIFPMLIALHAVIAGRLRQALLGAFLFALFAAAVLLSFSRAAWGQVVLTSVIVLLLTFVTTRSPHRRLLTVWLGLAGIVALSALLAILLSIGPVAELFQQRFGLEQSYDVGEQGRFGRHITGLMLSLDRPLGIGPLQFARYMPEDPHNSYLNAFMSGGWLSGACYLSLVLLTLAFGFRALFVATPWRSAMIVVYAAYVGVAVESVIIDSDHWRHAFLLLGLLWGLIAATHRHILRAKAPAGRLAAPSLAHGAAALARPQPAA
jgi:hypothetical protein